MELGDIRQVAGYFEAEGTFVVGRSNDPKRQHHSVHFHVGAQTTDMDVADWLSSKTLGTISPNVQEGRAIAWSVHIPRPQSFAWCMMIYPFMGNKRRRQIRQLLAAWRWNPTNHEWKFWAGEKKTGRGIRAVHISAR